MLARLNGGTAAMTRRGVFHWCAAAGVVLVVALLTEPLLAQPAPPRVVQSASSFVRALSDQRRDLALPTAPDARDREGQRRLLACLMVWERD